MHRGSRTNSGAPYCAVQILAADQVFLKHVTRVSI